MAVFTSRKLRNMLAQNPVISEKIQTEKPVQVLYVALDTSSAYSIPSGADSIRVMSGSAWVSYHAADHILAQADELPLDSRDSNTAIVTALNNHRVVLAVTLTKAV